jgi:hypothetical protein
VIVRRCSNGAEDKTLTAKPSQAKCTLRYVNTPVGFQWPRCRLWVNYGSRSVVGYNPEQAEILVNSVSYIAPAGSLSFWRTLRS